MPEAIPTPDLLPRLVQRDPKALELLYDRYSKALYALILSIVKKKEDAEEILGDVFLQIWEKASSYDLSKGGMYGWMATIARNRAIDRLRSKIHKGEKQAADIEGDMDIFHDPMGQLDAAELSQRADRVKAAMDRIAPEQRQVIEVAYFEGFSQSQIAERLELPLGTVKTRMRDGMKRLHLLLKELL